MRKHTKTLLCTQDGKRVLDCLQRALKIGDVCMQASTNVHLFVEILNRYLFYFEAGNEKITTKYIQGLLDLVSGLLSMPLRPPPQAREPLEAGCQARRCTVIR